MNMPRLTSVRQSLLRPMLLLGAERELIIVSGMIAAMLMFSLGRIVAVVSGVVLWFVSLLIFQRMAKYDPQLSRVFIRHVNKRVYYPAHPSFAAPVREVPKQQ
jgi:type IV secretion system protein TrbD